MKNKITYRSREGYVEGVLNCGYTFLIDLEDYSIVSRYNWFKDGDGYLRNRNLGYMHRFIAETPEGLQTDHINQDKRDNRRNNLRHVTHHENQANRKVTKEVGVYGTKQGKFEARIVVNKKVHYLGTFKNIQDAIDARKKAEKELLN